MAKDFPLGNGSLMINFDDNYNMRDIYYPRVGQENHGLNHQSRFGVWTEDGFFWFGDPGIKLDARYEEDTLVTRVKAEHGATGVGLELQDAVDIEQNLFIRRVRVENQKDRERQIRLYMHLDMYLYGSPIGDTVYYDPDLRSLVFYKRNRYISLSCMEEGKAPAPTGFAAGQRGMHGLEGTWRDAEDGKLEGNPISQGSVDGTVELALTVPAGGFKTCWFWVSFGRSLDEIVEMEGTVRRLGVLHYLRRTRNFWVRWTAEDKHDLSLLPPDIASLYKRSLLIIRTNMDNGGAIVAANDSDILKMSMDTYSYMWPRDGALIAHSLDRSGYRGLTRRFFDFCRRGLSRYHFMMHKYNPDGSPGSSWHPWIDRQGNKQFPIQEDESALVLYALWHHHKLSGTLDRSEEDYRRLAVPLADFMLRYRTASGLPLPSYDLWEERYGITAFTTATVYAGLLAAADFAEHFKEHARAILYREAAAKMKEAVFNHLYCEKEGRFLRALYWNEERKTFDPDYVMDASMYALFDFGLVAPDDPRMERTMRTMKEKLWVKTKVGGMARYEDDYYHQVSKDIERVPGNPWIICTLWYAEWLIAKAKSKEDLKEPEELIRWAMRQAKPSGVLPEQVHPFTGEHMSVSPLTWSHSTFIKVVQEYLGKFKQWSEGEAGRDRETVGDLELLRS